MLLEIEIVPNLRGGTSVKIPGYPWNSRTGMQLGISDNLETGTCVKDFISPFSPTTLPAPSFLSLSSFPFSPQKRLSLLLWCALSYMVTHRT